MLYTKGLQVLHRKRVSMLAALKVPSYKVNVYFTVQNIMQSGNPKKLNFEGLEMQK